MAFCNKGIEIIDRNECIGNSLSKINNNFVILDSTLCSLTGVTAGVGQIVAGSNITISPSSGTGVVTISGSAGVTGQEVLSADNAGTFGSRVFKEKVNQGLIFRRIASGSTNVTITEEDNTIRISAATSGGGEANVAANVGTGFGLALPKVGTFLPFKSLAAGTGINLLSSINSVVIQVSGENIGTGTGEILKKTTGATPLSLRRITAGANTTVSTIGDDVIIASSSATTGANIGTGTGAVLAGKLGDSFQFKTLKAGTNVEIINNPNDVQINATASGGGSQLIISDFPPQNATPGQLWFDSTSGVTSVYYNFTWVDVGGGDSTGGGDTTASNLGTVAEGAGLFTAKNGSDLPFKRIRGGNNVDIIEGPNSITINAGGGPVSAPVSVTGAAPIAVTNGEISIANATPSSAGAMSAADKIKLDGLGSVVIPPLSSSYEFLNTIYCTGFTYNYDVVPDPSWSLKSNGVASRATSFYIMRDGGLRACGLNSVGSCGTGRRERVTLPNICAFMPPLPLGVKVSRITYNYDSTYVVTSTGSLYAAGSNGVGQLGLNDATNRFIFYKVEIPEQVVDVSAGTGNDGSNGVLVLTQGGNVYSFGDGSSGSLGRGTNTNVNSTPQKITGIPAVKQIMMMGGANAGTGIILTTSGEVWTAGSNAVGQLGRTPSPATDNRYYRKVTIPDGEIIEKIWACGDIGNIAVWARSTTKKVYGWGHNRTTSYAVGTGGSGATNVLTPTLVPALEGVKEIYGAMGNQFGSFFATFTNGDAKGWGYNRSGHLGNNTTAAITTPQNLGSIWPFATNQIKDISIVNGGGDHAIYGATSILLNDGTIYTAGYGGRGYLGRGDNANSSIFKQVPFNYLLGKPVAIEGFGTGLTLAQHFKVLLDNGKVVAWGYQDANWCYGTDATPNTEFTPSYVLFS